MLPLPDPNREIASRIDLRIIWKSTRIEKYRQVYGAEFAFQSCLIKALYNHGTRRRCDGLTDLQRRVDIQSPAGWLERGALHRKERRFPHYVVAPSAANY